VRIRLIGQSSRYVALNSTYCSYSTVETEVGKEMMIDKQKKDVCSSNVTIILCRQIKKLSLFLNTIFSC
ncbi:MAG: hypothetical protein ACI8RD_007604, partial [Bacillariaceae sp.]|jgi:hypothetical protein